MTQTSMTGAGSNGRDSNRVESRSRFQPIRVALLSVFAGLSVLATTSCVPYTQHERTRSELARLAEINLDYKNRLEALRRSQSETDGSAQLANAKFSALEGQYEAALDELQACQENREELLRQLQELRQNPLPVPPQFDRKAMEGVGRVNDEGALVLENELLFSSGKAALKDSAKPRIQELARLLNGRYSDQQVVIEGHSDNTPIAKSKHKSNWDLSQKRAYAVFDYLVKQGIDEDRFRLEAYGYADPPAEVVDPNSVDGRRQSRRVEIRLGGRRN